MGKCAILAGSPKTRKLLRGIIRSVETGSHKTLCAEGLADRTQKDSVSNAIPMAKNVENTELTTPWRIRSLRSKTTSTALHGVESTVLAAEQCWELPAATVDAAGATLIKTEVTSPRLVPHGPQRTGHQSRGDEEESQEPLSGEHLRGTRQS